MIPPRWPFPMLHARGCVSSWRCEFPNSKQTELQFVCSLVASPCCRGMSIKGQPGSSPHLSTHAPRATGAGTTARANIPAHLRALFKGTVLVLKVQQKELNISGVTPRPDRTPYKQTPLHIKKALKHQSESSLAKLKKHPS